MVTENLIESVLSSTQAAVMGVLNLTPDSFSDGGRFTTVELALKHARQMVQDGVDIIDIGGESTRPGAADVSVNEELQRVIPVLQAIRNELPDVAVSVDTSKVEVMERALAEGAHMINDVNALQAEGAKELLAQSNAHVCLMHMKGKPRTMQQSPKYDDVVSEVYGFLQQQADDCIEAGISSKRIVLDPGIGFGKTLDHNLALLSALTKLVQMQYPVLVGVSRKSLIQHALDRDVDQRLAASLGLAVQATLKGAKILRVHDVRETYDAIRIVEMVNNVQQ